MKKLKEKNNQNYDFVLKQKTVEALIFSSSEPVPYDELLKRIDEWNIHFNDNSDLIFFHKNSKILSHIKLIIRCSYLLICDLKYLQKHIIFYVINYC